MVFSFSVLQLVICSGERLVGSSSQVQSAAKEVFTLVREFESLVTAFWAKMSFKLLSELSTCELRMVFRRAGRKGIFLESRAIVQLTIFLINIGQDPFTYRFQVSASMNANIIKSTEVNVAEESELVVIKEAEDVANVVSKLEFGGISDSTMGSNDGVSSVPGNEAKNSKFKSMKNEEVVSTDLEDVPVLVCQEILLISPSGLSGGLTALEHSSVSSTKVSISENSWFDSLSNASLSYEHLNMLSESSARTETTTMFDESPEASGVCCYLKNLLHLELWPPDLQLFSEIFII